MKLGIVGLPNVGKTTLFNALTGSQAETGSYTNASAKPNIGTAKVPDERLDWLAEYYHPKKYTPATIEFVDVPGVAAGGKGREVFQAIRMVDALVEVVRCFDDDSVFLEEADALRDAESFDLELILADLEIVERRLDRAKKNAKSGDKKYKREVEMCEQLMAHLEAETRNTSARWRCASSSWPTSRPKSPPATSPLPRRTRTSWWTAAF